MLYPENIADKLGFTEIRELLKSFCLSPMGEALAGRIQFITRVSLLERLLKQTAEFRELLQNDAPFPASGYFETRPYLDKMRPEHAFLAEDELFQLYQALSTALRVIHYLREREDRYEQLQALFEQVQAEDGLPGLITRVIDEKGRMREDASPRLLEIHQQIRRTEQESRKRLDSLFREAVREGWIADGSLTVREGRMVIPLLAEHKRRIKGFIHDESATGQTVFMEPTEVFELNNKVRDLRFEQRRETVRILTELTGQLRPYTGILEDYRRLLAKVDFIRAKALLAIRLDASLPRLSSRPSINLIQARHPLLWLSHLESGHPVVPLDISLGEEARIIVVSGPNAGGKSVCLKTVGLLQLMLQSGLLIPASEFSEMGIFGKVLADIGDDQSIESDLSTYSAHLSKMQEFISQAGPRTLLLIDEFGTGTDPQFGGPLAEAVLEALNRQEAKGVITTHYSNLKLFAGNTPGLLNASMLFDSARLDPLYRLEMGKPGSSYAFEIARKIGLPPAVLEKARQKAGAGQNRMDRLLIELEREKKLALDHRAELERGRKQLDALLEENARLKQYFEENRKKLLKEAKEEARDIISGANKLVENTIREIRQSEAGKEPTRKARGRLREAYGQLSAREQEEQERQEKKIRETIEPGNWVRIPGSDTAGEVLSVSKGSAVVAMGNLRTVVKLDQLEKTTGKREKPGASTGSYTHYQQAEGMKFSPDIDLRGMRGEAALAELERIVDRALMLGVDKLRIIHGKGDGILRKLIRNYLRELPQVSKLEDEHPDRGGDGVTYAYFE